MSSDISSAGRKHVAEFYNMFYCHERMGRYWPVSAGSRGAGRAVIRSKWRTHAHGCHDSLSETFLLIGLYQGCGLWRTRTTWTGPSTHPSRLCQQRGASCTCRMELPLSLQAVSSRPLTRLRSQSVNRSQAGKKHQLTLVGVSTKLQRDERGHYYNNRKNHELARKDQCLGLWPGSYQQHSDLCDT